VIPYPAVTPARRKFVLPWLVLCFYALVYPRMYLVLYGLGSQYEGIARAVFVVGLVGAIVSFLATMQTGVVATLKNSASQFSKEDVRTALLVMVGTVLGIAGLVALLQFFSPPR